MKKFKIIGFGLLLVIFIAVNLMISLFSNKASNEGFKLSMLYSLNQASAEDGTPAKFQIVGCWNEEITLPDGTKTIAHKVGCSGTGELECKCPGHSS